MWFKVTLGSAIYYDPECLILYRSHAEACCLATPLRQQLEARVRLYAWLMQYLRAACPERRPARSLRVMVRAKLCEALLRLLSLSAREAEGTLPPSRGFRLRACVHLLRPNLRALGCSFAALVLVGAFSLRTAAALARRL